MAGRGLVSTAMVETEALGSKIITEKLFMNRFEK